MRHWSDHELATLETMAKAGSPARTIARTIGRSESAVKRKVDRLKETAKGTEKTTRRRRRRRRARSTRAQRKCLVCGSMFKSEGIGNRICEPCKDNNRSLGHLEGVAA